MLLYAAWEEGMAMTDNEAIEVLERLRDMLLNRKLAWVLEQVSEEIHAGRLTTKPVKLSNPPPLWRDGSAAADERRHRSSTATFPATIEYSGKERLGLLIDAIEQGVVKLA